MDIVQLLAISLLAECKRGKTYFKCQLAPRLDPPAPLGPPGCAAKATGQSMAVFDL